MSRPVIVLGALGAVLGGLGALGWHWVPEFGDRWPPLFRLRPGQSPYSGVVTEDQVIHWAPVSWPAVVVLPVFGLVVGTALGGLVGRRTGGNAADAVAISGLGLLVGAASAVAWHVDPAYGVWAGLFEPKVDVGYPAAGLVLALVFLVGTKLRAAGSGGRPPTPPGSRPAA